MPSWIGGILALAFWPAALVAVVLAVIGVSKARPPYLAVAGVLVLAFAWYLTGFPGSVWHWMGVTLPASFFASGLATAMRRKVVAWLCLLPPTATFGTLAALVIAQ